MSHEQIELSREARKIRMRGGRDDMTKHEVQKAIDGRIDCIRRMKGPIINEKFTTQTNTSHLSH